MRERELLRHIYERSADLAGEGVIRVGPGDDCAVIRDSAGASLLLTVDQLVAGRHFDPERTPIDLVARKAIARSVSDIAAMAGTPICALATGAIPDCYAHADELFDRMATLARAFGCPLIGGDIAGADGPMVLTCTIVGVCRTTRGPVLRADARPGDLVCVTGRLGGSLESGRHLTFEPRVAEAVALSESLADRLGAMMDLSDGLGIDASRLAAASGVRLEIEAGRVPRHEGVADWRRAASDGEDYELLFTVRDRAGVERLELPRGTPLSVIGRVTEGAGCVIIDERGHEHDGADLGWDHGA
jgi:thiamine-monophosphate kinase